MRRITVTRNYFEFVCKTFIEVGYNGLDDYEKQIMDASDHDGLNIIENPSKVITRAFDMSEEDYKNQENRIRNSGKKGY